jgi:MHS family proline/betaine transporter-like MFS transporter
MGQEHIPLQRRFVVAGIAGNVMEWYDFAVYGYFAPIIGQQFFPSTDAVASLIAAFGVFAAGFLMRPIGAVVFGHIGDKIGRKPALTLSVLAMAIPTFLIGILPDYQHMGATASVLLILMRLIQGLSVGGEYTTSVVFLVEGAAPHRRGLAGSLSVCGATGGILLGSAIGALTSSALSRDAIDAWGWRVPFLLGLVVGLAGLYIRQHLPEPAENGAKATAEGGRSPVIEAFRSEWRTMLQIAGVNLLNAVGFYLSFVYVVTYFQDIDHASSAAALKINTINMVVLLVMIPSCGALSDLVNRKLLLAASAISVLAFAWPLFWLMHHPHDLLMFAGQLGFAVLLGVYFGALPAAMVEAVPEQVRCSGLSIAYNLCLGIIGGTTPMVATYLIAKTHDDLSPAYYIMAAAAITLVMVYGLRPAPARAAQSIT